MQESTRKNTNASWGHVAMSQTVGPNPETNSGWGVIRTVHAGVVHNTCASQPFRWKPAGKQKHFLSVDEDTLKGVVTLKEFARGLQSSTPTAKQLIELDQIAAELLGITRRLHQEGRQLSMVTGDNILLFGDGRLFLLDHGFHTEQAHFPPDWLTNPPADRVLWDRPVVEQQHNALSQGQISSAEDAHILIRVFQGLLINVWQKELVPADLLRTTYRTKSFPLWFNLQSLVESTSPDAFTQLESHIQQHPISSHFSKPAGTPSSKPPSTRIWPILAGMFLLLAGLGAAWQQRVWPFAPPPTNGSHRGRSDNPDSLVLKKLGEFPVLQAMTPTTDPKKLSELIKGVDEQEKQLEQIDAVSPSKDPGIAKQEQDEIGALRKRFLEQWEISFGLAIQLVDSEVTREEGSKHLASLRDHLLKIRKLTTHQSDTETQQKEKECLELLQTLRFDTRLPMDFRDSLLPH